MTFIVLELESYVCMVHGTVMGSTDFYNYNMITGKHKYDMWMAFFVRVGGFEQ